jgi:limonene-1,2-epoxide hydrolase
VLDHLPLGVATRIALVTLELEEAALVVANHRAGRATAAREHERDAEVASRAMDQASPEECLRIGEAWMRAFNAHDVGGLVALYAEDATHTSPKIRALHPETGGKLVGRAALHAWWTGSNARIPGLRYEATAFTANERRVVVEYRRFADGQATMPVAEVFEVEHGKIVASRVYHG